MKPMISEILELVEAQPTKKQKLYALQVHDNPALRQILKYVFDPSIKFLLPDSDPPFKPIESAEAQGRLYSEARKLYLFVEGGNPNLTAFKREMLFIQLLESVDPKEAQLILHVKRKKLPYKSITKKLVKEAFEGLL